MTASMLVDPSGASHEVERVHLFEPIGGVWFAAVKLLGEGVGVAGRCVLRMGAQDWVGTIDPEFSGTWGGSGSLRLVGGAHGWAKEIDNPKGYHSDAGVSGRTVATDAATACGETLAAHAGGKLPGVDYARPKGLASVTLEDTVGASTWWVARDGTTHVGTRPTGSIAQVLDWSPSRRMATLEAEDLTLVQVGYSVTDERIGSPLKIRDLEIRCEGSSVRAFAWCGGANDALGRLPRLLTALVRKVTEGPLWGSYRYRVVGQGTDGRVHLQVVRKSAGVPDLLPVTMWPGVAGAYAELADGVEVMVEFEEGDRARPFVSRFAPRGAGGFVPEFLALCDGTRPAAGVGDEVTTFMSTSPMAITGTVTPPGGSPMLFTGTGVFDSPLRGIITSGTNKVRLPP